MNTATTTDRTTALRQRAVRFAEQAAAALAIGFPSEAKRKDALADVNRAWDATKDLMMDRLLADYPDRDDATGLRAEELYWGLPDYPHNWKLKHAAMFRDYPDAVETFTSLAMLRDALKAATVEPKPIRQDHALLAFAKSHSVDLAALRDRRVAQYNDALDLGRELKDRLGEPLKGLPVSVHRVFCVNYAGTVWVRLDWFLQGRRVPFSTVAAAYDTLVREGTIVEEPR